MGYGSTCMFNSKKVLSALQDSDFHKLDQFPVVSGDRQQSNYSIIFYPEDVNNAHIKRRLM